MPYLFKMSHCCVPQCVNDSRYSKEFSFHTFPKDDKQRSIWIRNVRREPGVHFTITRNTYVCSEHFEPGAFRRTLGGRRFLRFGVAPTVFSWTGAVLKGSPKNTSWRKKEYSFKTAITDIQCNESCDTEQITSTPTAVIRLPDHGRQTTGMCQQKDSIKQLVETMRQAQNPPQQPDPQCSRYSFKSTETGKRLNGSHNTEQITSNPTVVVSSPGHSHQTTSMCRQEDPIQQLVENTRQTLHPAQQPQCSRYNFKSTETDKRLNGNCDTEQITSTPSNVVRSPDHGCQTTGMCPQDDPIHQLLEIMRQTQNSPQRPDPRCRPEKHFLERYFNDPTKIQFYTGFQTYTLLMTFFCCLLPHASRGLSSIWLQLRLVDQFYLFLNKVKLGSLDEDLADRFGVSTSTVHTVIISWANFLHALLGCDPVWPTRRMVDEHMPDVFKQFPKTRVILEYTELFVQAPSTLTLDSELYPDSRGRKTLRCLVGISPSGLVAFVSDIYAGEISDRDITKQCGILDLLQAGDSIMAHKEVIIDDLLQEINCTRTSPTMLQTIPRICVYTEWTVRRVKQFHLFHRTIPISLEGILNQLWRVCCMLPNFQGPFSQKSS